ncbi:MAG: tRNA lysidine(34) synthetase TilS [Magnetococcales bacterium]|nr:tRNA lysidine(34) synthetase TilS [Magnetococcales bacterium]
MSATRDHPLPARIHRATRPLIPPGARLMVAVSGGADSMALLHLLIKSGVSATTELIVAHFDHGLRIDSDQDALFVSRQAAALGVTCHVTRWNRPLQPGNLQEQARQARQAFLIRTAHHSQARHIAMAHHQDDQAETVLDRLLRGSGLRGLGAMRPAQPLTEEITLIRPLLDLRRQELRAWLQNHGLPWREDPSNQSPQYQRNRIRHAAIPALAQVKPEDPAPPLARSARLLACADDALEWSLERLWPELDPCLHHNPTLLSFAWSSLHALPAELLRRVLLRCHARLSPLPHPPGERATAQFIHLTRSRPRHWTMVMAGLTAFRHQERLFFAPHHGPAKTRISDRTEKELWETVEFSTGCPYDAKKMARADKNTSCQIYK